MSFLPNLADLKGMASAFNPLNALMDHVNDDRSTPVSPTPVSQQEIATAGPGPKSQAAAQEREAALFQTTLSVPGCPSPAKASDAPPTTFPENKERRRSSGNSVVLVDPEIDVDPQRQRRGTDGHPNYPHQSHRMSTMSDIRVAKKAPTDTYIIVRPPPTSAKNSLNLQIQLVVRDTRPRDRSVSRTNSVSTDLVSLAPSSSSGVDMIPSPVVSVAKDSNVPRSETSSQSSMEDQETPAPRTRSNSVKSNRTFFSGMSHRGTARSRVEPMFNLSVHNVMHSTLVTDAATDVKVAKFLKRSLDVLGVGVLEPAEVWLAGSTPLSADSSNDEETTSARRARPISMIAVGPTLSPSVNQQSDGATIQSHKRHSFDITPSRTITDLKGLRLDATHENPAKKFFGKVFKRKAPEVVAPLEARRSNTYRRDRSPSPNHSVESHPHPKVASGGPTPNPDYPHHSSHATFGTLPRVMRRRSSGTIVSLDGAVTGLTAPTTLAPPATLGSSPTPSVLNEKRLPVATSSRPIGYTWTVRKWAKKNNEGWAAHLSAAAAAGLEMVNGVITAEAEGDRGENDVVFEWVKQRVPGPYIGEGLLAVTSRVSKIKAPSRPSSRANSRPPSTTDRDTGNSQGASPSIVIPPSPNPILLDRRPDAVRRVSGSTSPRRVSPNHSDIEGDHETSSLHTLDTNADGESDPEDSEAPWTCSIWVKKTGQRQLLGTLTPAPHHPKVVGILKIPLRLDPVCLQEVRGQGKEGQEEAVNRIKEEVSLTEENLKDVVCTTSLWLVAREEFGGLGRKRRGHGHQ